MSCARPAWEAYSREARRLVFTASGCCGIPCCTYASPERRRDCVLPGMRLNDSTHPPTGSACTTGRTTARATATATVTATATATATRMATATATVTVTAMATATATGTPTGTAMAIPRVAPGTPRGSRRSRTARLLAMDCRGRWL